MRSRIYSKTHTHQDAFRIAELSLGTVQRALRGLVEQGLVVRRHGVATFVAETQLRMQDPWHCRFLDDLGSSVLPVFSEVLARSEMPLAGPWTRWLGTGSAFRIDRRPNIGGEFRVISHFYARRDVLDYFWNCPLDDLQGANFKAMVTRECRLPVTHITHDVRLMTLPSKIRLELRMKGDKTGLFMCAVASAGRDNTIYYQEFFIPPTHRFLRFSERYDGLNNGRG